MRSSGTSPSLFDRPVKQLADTSLQAYREIAPSLQQREALVLAWLRWATRAGSHPTAMELFAQMRAAGAVEDINSVRPRLTSLKERGRVVRGDKRTCSVTHKTAYTWVVREQA